MFSNCKLAFRKYFSLIRFWQERVQAGLELAMPVRDPELLVLLSPPHTWQLTIVRIILPNQRSWS